MSEIIFQEADFFMASFLCGVFLLVIYDGIRIIRRTFRHGKVMTAIEDMIFWLISGLMVFVMMYEKNDGTVRGTALLSIGLGMLLYHCFISSYVVGLGYRLIGKPVKKMYSFLFRGLKKIKKAVKLLSKQKTNRQEQGGQHEKRTKRSSKRSREST